MKFVVAVCVLIATIFLTRSSISPRVFGWKMRRYDMSNINRDQNQLVTSLEYGGVIRNQDVASVFRDVDRKFFVNGAENSLYAYMDSPLPIGSGQTISAPHMHAGKFRGVVEGYYSILVMSYFMWSAVYNWHHTDIYPLLNIHIYAKRHCSSCVRSC